MKVENDMLHPAPRAPKTIAAVHDISCYGRCSMQAVWPVLSHYGHLVCPLPTALLSTHTGGFDHFTFLDLGGEMKKILASWREEGLRFDAVYSGFLGSAGQIGTVLSLIEDQPGALVLVDPVMGDCGEIYKTYTPEMCELMHRLCARADIITPNLTEACLLAGVPYDPEPDDAAVDALLGRLDGVCRKAARTIVVTGVRRGDEIGAACSDTREGDGRTVYRFAPYCSAFFPGCGDLLASILLAGVLSGECAADALGQAVEFISLVSHKSQRLGTPTREGVVFENELYRLT